MVLFDTLITWDLTLVKKILMVVVLTSFKWTELVCEGGGDALQVFNWFQLVWALYLVLAVAAPIKQCRGSSSLLLCYSCHLILKVITSDAIFH